MRLRQLIKPVDRRPAPYNWRNLDFVRSTTAGAQTITVLKNSMGANGAIRIDVIVANRSGSVQTFEIDFGSTNIFSLSISDTNSVNPKYLQVWNDGSTSSQRSMPTDAAGHGAYSSTFVTPSEDTTSDVTITFDSATTGNLIIEYATVELIYRT